ncbi:DUF3644 domain-containing protein [Microbacterium fluvii]|uniref:DUF3644 domain-containing protein n=1 Tax=Microbacterium fluvii TaxID=415215 RepID=A0ABW2HEL1_9MICO|nr:DUF3644 domain-containing protein [Microbacterium fluvii]MCU4671806.1 hypothetical protein [Microbacterium fluvii]
MKKEARLLKAKAVASLLLSIDHFNRLSDVGRVESVLILMDHAFEMLLKSAILNEGGRIREPREVNTIGFDACVRRGLSTERFLTDEQALVLQTINGLRDAAQHHLLELSEGQLYIHAQSGVTLFRDLLRAVFGENLATMLPERALPISTVAPIDPISMFAEEVEEVRRLLAPGRRRHAEAAAKLRGLAIVNGALEGEFIQPSERQLSQLGQKLVSGSTFDDLFPGISAVSFNSDGEGADVSLRITKNEGIPVHLVPEGTSAGGVIAVKRVDELGFYNLSHSDLAGKLKLSPIKTTAAIAVLGLKEDLDCSKAFKIGRSVFQRYSQKSIDRIRALVQDRGIEDVWTEYRALQSQKRKP